MQSSWWSLSVAVTSESAEIKIVFGKIKVWEKLSPKQNSKLQENENSSPKGPRNHIQT